MRKSFMSPETYNRLQNTSKEDFDRFVDWLFSHTLAEVRAARGDSEATRAAWIRYLRRGVKADLLLHELMAHVPELFRRAQYADYDAPKVLAMIKGINLAEIGVGPVTGAAQDEHSGVHPGG
jgi:hypothetical protein